MCGTREVLVIEKFFLAAFKARIGDMHSLEWYAKLRDSRETIIF